MSEFTNINRVKMFEKGDVIFHEGQPSDHFYILQKGEIEVSIRKQDKRFVIGTLGPGEFFGEMGLLTNEPRSASCRAMTAVEVARISNVDFKNILKNSHPLTGKIVNVLLRRLKRSNGLSTNVTTSANPFYSVAALLDLNFRAANSDSISAGAFIKQMTLIFGLLPYQAKEIIHQFSDFGVIRHEKKLNNSEESSSFQEDEEGRLLLLSHNILEVVRKAQDTLDKALLKLFTPELELMDINEALELYGVDQKEFYGKICSDYFPEHLFLIKKSVLFELIKEKGKHFFE